MLPRGGTITLRSGIVDLGASDLAAHYPGQDLSPGHYVVLEVSDEGPGMAPAVKDRAFEPFFSTRAMGRGLGLAAVQGILRGHGGGVQVESEVDHGTTFRVVFPTVEPPAPPPPSPGGAKPLPDTTGSTILVVDDEPILRQTAASALRFHGFQTLEASDGIEALEVFEAHREAVSLVLLDLTMPRMDGEEAYRRLRQAGARMPILLTSGYGREEAFRRFRFRSLAGFLQKPYRAQALVDAVTQALDPRLWGWKGPVEWSPELETGHAVMDAQHRELLQAFNQVAALAQGGGGSVPMAFARFLDLCRDHFQAEEDICQVFPEAHRQLHAQLMDQLLVLDRKVQTGAQGFDRPTLDFLEDWLLCHMQHEDRDLARAP